MYLSSIYPSVSNLQRDDVLLHMTQNPETIEIINIFIEINLLTCKKKSTNNVKWTPEKKNFHPTSK